MSRLRLALRAYLNKLFHPTSGQDETPTARFRSVLVAFLGLGFHVGVWAVLLADLADSLDMSPGMLGVSLSTMTASGIIALLVGGKLADRFGRRVFLLFGIGGTGIFFLLLVPVGGSGSYTALLAALVFGGICASSWDLAVNSLGGDHESQHGARVMTLLHAGFSGGAAAGALLSGAVLWAGVGFRSIYAVVGIALLVLAVLLWRSSLPRHPATISPAADAVGPVEPRRNDTPPSLLLVPAVAACALMIFMSFSTDAALEGFLSLYLRDVLSSGALLGGVGVAAFHIAATVGRLASGPILRRVGDRSVLTLCGLASASGMTCVVLAGRPQLAAAALLLVGLAAAPIAPVIFSLTARAAPEASGRAISLVTISGYVAFTAGPLLIGTVADLTSLRVSLLLPVTFGLGVAAAARFLPSLTSLAKPTPGTKKGFGGGSGDE